MVIPVYGTASMGLLFRPSCCSRYNSDLLCEIHRSEQGKAASLTPVVSRYAYASSHGCTAVLLIVPVMAEGRHLAWSIDALVSAVPVAPLRYVYFPPGSVSIYAILPMCSLCADVLPLIPLDIRAVRIYPSLKSLWRKAGMLPRIMK